MRKILFPILVLGIILGMSNCEIEDMEKGKPEIRSSRILLDDGLGNYVEKDTFIVGENPILEMVAYAPKMNIKQVYIEYESDWLKSDYAKKTVDLPTQENNIQIYYFALASHIPEFNGVSGGKENWILHINLIDSNKNRSNIIEAKLSIQSTHYK